MLAFGEQLRAMLLPAMLGAALMVWLISASLEAIGSASDTRAVSRDSARPDAPVLAAALSGPILPASTIQGAPALQRAEVVLPSLTVGGYGREARKRLAEVQGKRRLAFVPLKMVLTRGSRRLIDDIGGALGSQPGNWRLRVRVHAHTWGSSARNAEVSATRAEVLAERFREAGIDPSRLFAEGVGDREPVADLKTPHGRRLARRIEVFIEEG